MTNETNNTEVPDCIFNSNILTEKEPIGILQLINQGHLSRINAWKVLQLVHAGEVKCGLPQYGIVTVFSLSKDINQFKIMFDQGCDMLRDNGIIDDEFEKATFIELSKIMAKKSSTINIISPLDKPSKTGKKKKSTNKKSKSN